MNNGLRAPILILGIGNILLRDEGVGVRVVEKLADLDLPDHVEIVDGGTAGADLLDVIADRSKLIVVDAVDIDSEPGAVVRFTDAQPLNRSHKQMSLHELGIIETIQMTKQLGCPPEKVVFFGIKPADLTPGLDLSPTVADSVDIVIEQLLKEIHHAHPPTTNS
jgi:hydrogenase maturation protease